VTDVTVVPGCHLADASHRIFTLSQAIPEGGRLNVSLCGPPNDRQDAGLQCVGQGRPRLDNRRQLGVAHCRRFAADCWRFCWRFGVGVRKCLLFPIVMTPSTGLSIYCPRTRTGRSCGLSDWVACSARTSGSDEPRRGPDGSWNLASNAVGRCKQFAASYTASSACIFAKCSRAESDPPEHPGRSFRYPART
jgi:hypothetical protein